jgi:hypothetical protein
LICGIGVAALMAAGCSKKDPAETVGQRAIERWDLLAGKQAVKAYDYLSPGYRSTHTLEQYVAFIATSRVRWKSAKVESVQCDEETCTAKLKVISTLPGAMLHRSQDMEYTTSVAEKWVRGDGQWYFLPDARVSARGIAGQAAEDKAAQTKDLPTPPPSEQQASPSPQPPSEPGKEGKPSDM